MAASAKISGPERVRKHSPTLTTSAFGKKGPSMATPKRKRVGSAPQVNKDAAMRMVSVIPGTNLKVREFGQTVRAGDRINRLVVLGHQFRVSRAWLVVVQCDCGTCQTVKMPDLFSGRHVSCGCYKSEIASRRERERAIHGERHTRLYGIWRGIKKRCSEEASCAYKHYGRRGIRVCAEWRESYVAFRARLSRMGTTKP